MKHKITLEGSSREGTTQALRRQGQIPAVLYGHGVDNSAIAIDSRTFLRVFEEAGYTSLVELKLSGNTHHVLIRDVQLHPLKDTVIHADLYQVRLDEKVTAEVPLVFDGESSAVKDLGGVLVRNIDTLEVEAFPQDLPREITVDISTLTDFEQVIYVKNLPLPEGVVVLQDEEDVVALVQPPRSDEELKELEKEATEDVSAVEGVKEEMKPEEGEESAEENKEAEKE